MIEVEEANGLKSVGRGGHRWLDVTDKPMPTIQAGRPVNIRITPPHTIDEGFGEMEKRRDLGGGKTALHRNGYSRPNCNGWRCGFGQYFSVFFG